MTKKVPFTKEFEREAVRLAQTSGRTRREIADDLGLTGACDRQVNLSQRRGKLLSLTIAHFFGDVPPPAIVRIAGDGDGLRSHVVFDEAWSFISTASCRASPLEDRAAGGLAAT